MGLVVVFGHGQVQPEKYESMLKRFSEAASKSAWEEGQKEGVLLFATCALGMSKHDSDIVWDEENKRFRVKVFLKDGQEQRQLMPWLGVDVAQGSSCSCGSKLRLEDYSLRRVGEEIEFEGTYVCRDCSLRQRTFLGRLRRIFSELWTKTSKVELGPNGLKYEKSVASGCECKTT
jgi:hypothetical protein